MRKWHLVLILIGLMTIELPMSAASLGLDVEAKGGAGVALGTTDNPDITGAARLAANGGVGVDLYLVSLGSIDLGISTGVEYSSLTFHSTWSNFQGLGTDQTADSTYGYLNMPIALVGRIPVSPSIQIVARLGGFLGYFLGGSTKLTYNPEIPAFGLTNGTQTLDSSNTNQWEYGLHVTAGADISLGGSLTVAPALQFDMGLTDTTVNSAGAGNFKDTFWSLTAIVGIKYKVM
jgi:hypothetical protein